MIALPACLLGPTPPTLRLFEFCQRGHLVTELLEAFVLESHEIQIPELFSFRRLREERLAKFSSLRANIGIAMVSADRMHAQAPVVAVFELSSRTFGTLGTCSL
ncbi:hypothetical protein WS46_32160 [Burkholderia sp. RF4-BP95]|nr:hypothetical protein WS46_32160 [Burkholderia sp. RF4-BP95]